MLTPTGRRLKVAKLDTPSTPSAGSSPGASTAPRSSHRPSTPADHTPADPPSMDYLSPNEALVKSSPASDLQCPQPHQINFVELDRFKIIGPSANHFKRVIKQLEAFYRAEFAVGSLRTELLLGLTRLNFLRALCVNIEVLGYSAVEMHDDAYSPFGCAGAAKASYKPVDTLPPALRPTAIQLSVPHHPWLDLIPFPKLRDNLILMGEELDDTQLCCDMSGRGVSTVSEKRLGVAGGETGVIVWRDPWDPSGWEVTESFLSRWGWALRECWDLFAATNRWRRVRGEPVLFRVQEIE
ncbi:hypothetical protein BJX63DRAFT_402323 [Aspergillus granulosus]|uniref:Uncharacterized protein n=1 Tax=Aspergillus granulosus TaxID=176169 RepID=A0ABR4H4C7_9EURO